MFRRNQGGVKLDRFEIYHPALNSTGARDVTLNVPEPELEPEPVQSAVAVMERAKGTIVPFDSCTDLAELDSEIRRLSCESAKLLGIEAHAKDSVSKRIADLRREKHIARAFERFNGSKLRLSNEVLTWRKSEPAYISKFVIPLPEVALFSLDMPTASIRSNRPTMGIFDPSLPWGLKKLYEDVWRALGGATDLMNFYNASISITAAFSGVIPTETREKIAEVKASGAFDEIRLLAEADWAVDIHPNPYYADPIVVGLVEDQMWVIDVFDPTPLEEYIASEFTS